MDIKEKSYFKRYEFEKGIIIEKNEWFKHK